MMRIYREIFMNLCFLNVLPFSGEEYKKLIIENNFDWTNLNVGHTYFRYKILIIYVLSVGIGRRSLNISSQVSLNQEAFSNRR